MSEIRQCQATKRWVIMATERAKRPTDFLTKRVENEPLPEHSSTCPFCPGNEHMTPPEVYALRPVGGPPDSQDWQVRVIPNRFPALRPEGEVTVSEPLWFTTVSGVGIHEVVVENPRHNANPATMRLDEVTHILTAIRERERAFEQDRRLNFVAFFRNNGLVAGSSLTHPHTQIIATPIAPTDIRNEIEEARRHYDDRLHCVYCEMIERECDAGARMVFETEEYVAFEPFAPRWPFETWLIAKRHMARARLVDASHTQMTALARALHMALGALYRALDNPAYNLIVHEAPLRDSCEDYYHWHIEILPRLSTAAGFELGTGIYINSALPEESACFLREYVCESS